MAPFPDSIGETEPRCVSASAAPLRYPHGAAYTFYVCGVIPALRYHPTRTFVTRSASTHRAQARHGPHLHDVGDTARVPLEQQRRKMTAGPRDLGSVLTNKIKQFQQPHSRPLPLVSLMGTHGFQRTPQGAVNVPHCESRISSR